MRFITIELNQGRTFWNCAGIVLSPSQTRSRELREDQLSEPFKQILAASVKAGEVKLSFRVEEEAKTFLPEDLPKDLAKIEEAIEVLVDFDSPAEETTVEAAKLEELKLDCEEYLKLKLVKLKNKVDRELKQLSVAEAVKVLDQLLEAEEKGRNRVGVKGYLRELLDSKAKVAGIKIYDEIIEEEEGELITFRRE